uniref:Uncharacterized protein n=1 Tax=Oryza nivara TaxID=4536 RepID=A0A0E0FRA8_ORYNI
MGNVSVSAPAPYTCWSAVKKKNWYGPAHLSNLISFSEILHLRFSVLSRRFLRLPSPRLSSFANSREESAAPPPPSLLPPVPLSPSRLSLAGSRGGGSDGFSCSRGPDPGVAVESAATIGGSGDGGGGGVSGRRIRRAILYHLLLTLHAQACPAAAAVTSVLPWADPAEVAAAFFLRSPTPSPSAPSFSLGSGGGDDLPDIAAVPSRPDLPVLLVVYGLFLFFLCDDDVVAVIDFGVFMRGDLSLITIWIWIEIEILFLGRIVMMWDLKRRCATEEKSREKVCSMWVYLCDTEFRLGFGGGGADRTKNHRMHEVTKGKIRIFILVKIQ